MDYKVLMIIGWMLGAVQGTGLTLIIAAILIRQEYFQDITGVLPVESPDELQISERGRKHGKDEG